MGADRLSKGVVSVTGTVVLALVLGACSSTGGGYYQNDGPGSRRANEFVDAADAQPRDEPIVKASTRPYVVFGRKYVPLKQRQPLTENGKASWYGKQFHGRPTSIGEKYDMYKMTAAHPTLPLPSYVRVTNSSNGRSVVVRVNDRGPFLNNRIIDLSFAAAAKLGYIEQGTADVSMEVVDPMVDTLRSLLARRGLGKKSKSAPKVAQPATKVVGKNKPQSTLTNVAAARTAPPLAGQTAGTLARLSTGTGQALATATPNRVDSNGDNSKRGNPKGVDAKRADTKRADTKGMDTKLAGTKRVDAKAAAATRRDQSRARRAERSAAAAKAARMARLSDSQARAVRQRAKTAKPIQSARPIKLAARTDRRVTGITVAPSATNSATTSASPALANVAPSTTPPEIIVEPFQGKGVRPARAERYKVPRKAAPQTGPLRANRNEKFVIPFKDRLPAQPKGGEPPPRVYLQLGAYETEKAARAALTKAGSGLRWLRQPVNLYTDRGLHKLQAGPFASSRSARIAARRIRSESRFSPFYVFR